MTAKRFATMVGLPIIGIAAIVGGVLGRNQYVNHDWKTFRQTEEVKLKLFNEYDGIAKDLGKKITEQDKVIAEKQKALEAVEGKLNKFNGEHKGELTKYSTYNTICANVTKAEKDLADAKAKKEALTKEKEKNEKYRDSYKKVEEAPKEVKKVEETPKEVKKVEETPIEEETIEE